MPIRGIRSGPGRISSSWMPSSKATSVRRPRALPRPPRARRGPEVRVRRNLAAHDDAGALRRGPPSQPEPQPLRSEGVARPSGTGRRIALYQWAFSVVLLLVVVGTVGTYMLRRTATDQAIRDARALTEVTAEGILKPELTPAVINGEPAAVQQFDTMVKERARLSPIVPIKVWSETGKVIYSDEPGLTGKTFPLSSDQIEAFEDNAVKGEVSNLTLPENQFERDQGKLMEVYKPLTLDGGSRVLVETYQQASRIDASSNRIWRAFVPVFLVTLAALAIAQLPLGYWLARPR